MISTSLSATSSSYDPYAFAEEGAPTFFKKSLARLALLELAAATISCLISLTSRVSGLTVRSLEKLCNLR
jgi:hypothetical protein